MQKVGLVVQAHVDFVMDFLLEVVVLAEGRLECCKQKEGEELGKSLIHGVKVDSM